MPLCPLTLNAEKSIVPITTQLQLRINYMRLFFVDFKFGKITCALLAVTLASEKSSKSSKSH